jgi:hypothetical protein
MISLRAIDAHVNLRSSASFGTGGVFDIRSQTMNGLSITNIHTAPVDSLIHVDTSTNLHDIRVHLPAAYEGAFVVETAFNRTDLTVDDHVADPAGKGRQRQVVHKDANAGIAGEVSWLPKRKNAKNGLVKVKTDIGRATLVI